MELFAALLGLLFTVFIIWGALKTIVFIVTSIFKPRNPTDDDEIGEGMEYKEVDEEIVKYKYTRKRRIMTDAEVDFHYRLQNIINNRYELIPQANLTIFLNHEKLQYGHNERLWAKRQIDRYSVDYLLCSNDMQPFLAIELDDSTHNWHERKERDAKINAIMRQSEMPILRLRKVSKMTDAEILNAIVEAINLKGEQYVD